MKFDHESGYHSLATLRSIPAANWAIISGVQNGWTPARYPQFSMRTHEPLARADAR
jgi:hypothetical protein